MKRAESFELYGKRSRSVKCALSFAHGFALQVEAVAGMDDAIEDGVGDGRIVEIGVPLIDWQLTGVTSFSN